VNPLFSFDSWLSKLSTSVEFFLENVVLFSIHIDVIDIQLTPFLYRFLAGLGLVINTGISLYLYEDITLDDEAK